MRRFLPTLMAGLAFATLACTEPPKPDEAEDLGKTGAKGDAKGKATAQLGEIPSGPIATVNGVEIPNAKFREVYDLKVKKYSDRGREIPPSADRRYRKSIAERLIYQEVLRQEAEKQGVKYDEAELAKREEQQKRGIRDWEKHLGRRGETEQSLRAMYVAELLERGLLEKAGKLEVTPEEIDAEYEKIKKNYKSEKPRVRASHILVPIGPERGRHRHGREKEEERTEEQKKQDEKEALAKAKEVHALATAADADFAKVAEEHSTGPSASKGGDLGIFTPDRMVEEFSDVAFKMKIGEVSKPVKTKFGYHIIKVTGKWGPGELPKEALADQIQERMRQRRIHQGRRELKETLLEAGQVVDNIKPTLGPEPTPRRPKRRPGQGKGGPRRGKGPGKGGGKLGGKSPRKGKPPRGAKGGPAAQPEP
jgi:parvulin-like peptidyl-prolyl isomerase